VRPELETLPAGSAIVRVHHRRFGPTDFNTPRALPLGDPVVPTLYAARDDHTALVESLFDDVPLSGSRQLARAAVAERVLSRLETARDLRLITVRDRGLIEAPASGHRSTSDWAQALHDDAPEADGMIWMARRVADRPAMVLFGDRITADGLHVTSASLPLWHGAGLELVEEAAMRADIALLL
jgi:RES domain